MSKAFIYFVCFSFLLSISSFPIMDAEAKEISFPIGELVSRGDVKFEVKEKVWKNIASSRYPIFQKGRIMTDEGTGIITLANNCQVEIYQHSILTFDQMDRLNLSQGKVNFRIPSGTEVIFKVGNLTVTKPRVMQATKSATTASPKSEETIGSISLHPNGSVTVKSLQGSLSILNEDRVVLAGLSSKESITLPSIMASGKSRTMVAQAGEIKEERREEKIAGAQEWEYLGLNAIEWIAVGYAAALVGGLIYAFWPEDEKVRRAEQVPSCP
jgi:hypothetical protein